jgi:hypothetical protein
LYLLKIEKKCVAFKAIENPCATQLKLFQDLQNIAKGKGKSAVEYYKRMLVSNIMIIGADPDRFGEMIDGLEKTTPSVTTIIRLKNPLGYAKIAVSATVLVLPAPWPEKPPDLRD